jgi:hypothetical protein
MIHETRQILQLPPEGVNLLGRAVDGDRLLYFFTFTTFKAGMRLFGQPGSIFFCETCFHFNDCRWSNFRRRQRRFHGELTPKRREKGEAGKINEESRNSGNGKEDRPADFPDVRRFDDSNGLRRKLSHAINFYQKEAKADREHEFFTTKLAHDA